MGGPSYVIITPVRNEGDRIQATIDSIVGQTLLPHCCVIVDDGSTDGTGDLIERASKQHPWIRAVRRPDRGFRKPGGGVIEAFYEGYALVSGQPWEFVVKLDGDLAFGTDYFEKCFARFAADPKLGIGGGTICSRVNGELAEEVKGDPPFHVRGATKIYRRACWEAIGDLLRAPGWDTVDEVKANMLGWRTYSFKDLKLHQLKDTGVADGSWKNWVKNGLANYVAGYHPLFMVLKCLRRVVIKPYVVAAAGLLSGFFGGYMKSVPQVQDKALIEYIRSQQLKRLLGRKSIWG